LAPTQVSSQKYMDFVVIIALAKVCWWLWLITTWIKEKHKQI